MANEAALLELVNVIGEANERGEWNQTTWGVKSSCGTTLCAAGWKATIDKQEIVWQTTLDGDFYTSCLQSGQTIEDYATEALDLTWSEAFHLFFYGGDDYDEFVVRVKHVINGEV